MKAFNKLKSHTNRLVTRISFFIRPRIYKKPTRTAIYFKDDAIGDFLFGSPMIPLLQAQYDQVILVCVAPVLPIAELFLAKSKIDVVDKAKFSEDLEYRMAKLKNWLSLEPSLVVMSSLRSSFVDQAAQVLKSASKNQIRMVSTDDPAPKKRRHSRFYTALSAHPPDTEIDKKYLCGAHRKEHLLIELALEKKLTPDKTRPILPAKKLKSQRQDPYFCILPDTGDPRRTYRTDDILSVASRTAAKYKMPGVILSAQKLKGSYDNLEDLTGATSLLESLSLIAGAQLTLTNETGLGHASWMLGRPTVMIMPGGNFAHFHATDPSLNAIFDERPCFNCHHNCQFQFKDRFPCIEDIPLSKIESAVAALAKNKHA